MLLMFLLVLLFMLLLLLSFLLDLSALNLLSKCVGNPVQNLRMFSNPFKQLSDGAWEILRRNYESFKINSNNSERYVENSSQIPWLLLVVLLYRSAWWVVGDSCYCCCCYCYSCYCCYSSLLDKNICIYFFLMVGLIVLHCSSLQITFHQTPLGLRN